MILGQHPAGAARNENGAFPLGAGNGRERAGQLPGSGLIVGISLELFG